MIKAVIFFIVLLLKIIGILTLAGLLLFACLLFVPVRYTVKGENSRLAKPPELSEPAGKNSRFYYNIQINVSWFLHAIRYTFDYSSDGTSGTLRVFGLDLQKLSAKWKSRRKRSKQKNSGTQESQKNKPHESASGKPEQTELERAELEKINDEKSDSKKADLKESGEEKADKEKSDKKESDLKKRLTKKRMPQRRPGFFNPRQASGFPQRIYRPDKPAGCSTYMERTFIPAAKLQAEKNKSGSCFFTCRSGIHRQCFRVFQYVSIYIQVPMPDYPRF